MPDVCIFFALGWRVRRILVAVVVFLRFLSRGGRISSLLMQILIQESVASSFCPSSPSELGCASGSDIKSTSQLPQLSYIEEQFDSRQPGLTASQQAFQNDSFRLLHGFNSVEDFVRMCNDTLLLRLWNARRCESVPSVKRHLVPAGRASLRRDCSVFSLRPHFGDTGAAVALLLSLRDRSGTSGQNRAGTVLLSCASAFRLQSTLRHHRSCTSIIQPTK
jgi:hypothetical protein